MAMFHSLPSIHVKHQKNTAELESVVMPVPAEVTISMSQHIGAPCKPVVKVGDTVKVTYDRNGSQQSADVVLEEMPQDKSNK